MEKLFEIINLPSSGKDKRPAIRLGVRICLAGQPGVCPFTGPLDNYQALVKEIAWLKEELDDLQREAERTLPESEAGQGMGINPDLPPKEIWAALSEIAEEGLFVRSFNDLTEEKRRSVAEYVLTQCNIFSGRPSLFSSRYNQNSAKME